MGHAIFYMHQTNGTCAGMCTHQMDKTETGNTTMLNSVYDFQQCTYLSKTYL